MSPTAQQACRFAHCVDASGTPVRKAGYECAKRAFDIAAAAAGLVLLSPVMLATAVAIVADDGFPVIYAAPRQGRGGTPFSMYKFRSMHRGAEGLQAGMLAQDQGCASRPAGAAFKATNDPRVTRTGRFIRKYFIDELPQLANVLKGDMSIVGPRAIQQTRPYTPYEAQRLAVRPGLTCTWQTSGNRGMPWSEWVELDLAYIRNRGIALDLAILAKTVGTVLRGQGDQ